MQQNPNTLTSKLAHETLKSVCQAYTIDEHGEYRQRCVIELQMVY